MHASISPSTIGHNSNLCSRHETTAACNVGCSVMTWKDPTECDQAHILNSEPQKSKRACLKRATAPLQATHLVLQGLSPACATGWCLSRPWECVPLCVKPHTLDPKNCGSKPQPAPPPLCHPFDVPTWCLAAYFLPALLDGVLQCHECGQWCVLVVLL